MLTLAKIKNALAKIGVAEWRINDTETESVESFFVKKELDTRRAKKVEKFQVTVFCKEEKDGTMKKGTTSLTLTPETDNATLMEKLTEAFKASKYVLNPDYPSPKAVKGKKQDNALAESTLNNCEEKMVKALFAEDNNDKAFLNSAELFVEKRKKTILSSEGTKVVFYTGKVKGEFVVQCKEPEDVEMHNIFEYDFADETSLREKVKKALAFVADRARAEKILKTGNYSVILCGEQLPTVMEYYLERSHASMIYPHYSEWKVGDQVQKAKKGEKLQLTLTATEPYSAEGIVMKDRILVKNGTLKCLHGANRFSSYVGATPTGDYEKFTCNNEGTMTLEEMKKQGPCLMTVVYSDFQMDAFTGHFGGEIRLAYLIDGDKIVPVTGGSINGVLPDCEGNMIFSKERYNTSSYDGPYAMLVESIPVAGV